MANQHYIYSPHKSSNTQLRAWAKSIKIGTQEIAQIQDTVSIQNHDKIASAVPSPFARMYLFENAFEIAANEPIGNTLYHKLVSDCLDIFQLLFDMTDASEITFNKWVKATEIGILKASEAPQEHKLLGETFSMFLDSPRFAAVNEIIFIKYKNELLGGTSPLTVFFTSPNWKRKMKEHGWTLNRTTNNSYFDDNNILALSQRDSKFISFFVAYYHYNKDILFDQFPALAKYVANFLKNSDYSFNEKQHIRHFEEEYEPILISNNIFLNVCGLICYRRKQSTRALSIENESAFVIQPTVAHFKEEINTAGTKTYTFMPLVLVNGYNKPNMTYIQDSWHQDTFVPNKVEIPLHERILPGNIGIKYPFLTAEDFLESSLIEMPFNLNEEYFYTGFEGRFPFILPIKKEYFNYFTLSDLRANLNISRRSSNAEDKIVVDLKIPIKNGDFITFHKEYNILKDSPTQFRDTLAATRGSFGFGIFPFYQILDNIKLNDYSIMVVDRDAREVKLSYYRFNRIAKNEEIYYNSVVRVAKQNLGNNVISGSTFHRLKGQIFDLIEVKVENFSGIIIPDWNKRTIEVNRNIHSFTFGIDMGTTTTHIAYQKEREEICPFDISAEELQVVMLNRKEGDGNSAKNYDFGFGQLPDMNKYKRREFMPSIIGNYEKCDYDYPIRTATCESIIFRTTKANLFANINIGFSLDIERMGGQNDIYEVDIKWGMEKNIYGGMAARERIKAFLLQSMWMIKNKIILNNGRLEQTKIVHFLPTSMLRTTKKSFRKIWKECIVEIFGENSGVQLFEELESAAPYFFIRKYANLYSSQNALTIDIGGGTTDLLFIIQKNKRYISSSFRFGGNDIWGEGFCQPSQEGKRIKDNGFVLFIDKKVQNNEIRFSDSMYREYYDENINNPNFSSADVINFIFGYEKEFHFSKQIERHPLRLILILHFSSLIYHIAQMCETLNIDVPMYLIFTGHASKYILMIGEEEMNDLAKIILSKTLINKQIPHNLKLILVNNPKETTANGGIVKVNEDFDFRNLNIEHSIYPGFEPSVQEIDKELVLREANKFMPRVLENYNKFINLFFEDRQIKNFLYEIELTLRPEDKLYLMEQGELSFEEMYYLQNEVQDADLERITETMFFWCLKGTLYKWSRRLYSRYS